MEKHARKANLPLPSIKQISTSNATWLRSSAYVVISLLYRALGLLLVPITVAVLSAEEFSRYGLMTSVIALLTTTLSLNIHVAPGRLFFDYDNRLEQSAFLSTTLIASSGLIAVSTGALFLVLRIGDVADPVSLGSIGVQVFVLLAIISTVLFQFSITLLRIKTDVVRYGILYIFQRIMLIGGFICLNALMANSFQALVLAYSSSTVFSGILGLYYCRAYVEIMKPRRKMFREALRFSTPLMVHSIALWAVTSSGRWIGTLHISLEDLAPYTLVTFFFSIVSMLPRALFEARVPDIGTAFARHDYGNGVRIINVTILFSVLIVVGMYASAFVILFGLNFRLPDAYMPTPLLLAVAATANVFDAIYLRGIQLLTAIKQTPTQAAVTIVSGVITVIVSFMLVRVYGDLGLVIAFAAGMFLQAIGANLVAQQRVVSLRRAKSTSG